MSEICRKEKIVFQDAVRLMKEIYGIDMESNGQRSKLISEIPEVDMAISMGWKHLWRELKKIKKFVTPAYGLGAFCFAMYIDE